jgi:hypothetical protein
MTGGSGFCEVDCAFAAEMETIAAALASMMLRSRLDAESMGRPRMD